MNCRSNAQFACSNRRLLISLFFALLSVSLALVGLSAMSKGTGDSMQSMSSPQTAAATANAQPHSRNATPRDNPHRYLDEKGYRANGTKPGAELPARHHGKRPAGSGAWVSLGPPGGDVFDVAASTLDANIV